MLKRKEIHSDLPWLSAHRERLSASLRAGTCPHSLIIQGPEGMGRRDLAVWLAETALGAPVVRAGEQGLEPAHPDFMVLEPTPDKNGKERKTIGIDQVREDLIPFLALTSHGSGGRVALIYPADTMTVNAANSLLKTLEEPPPGALIILITQTLAGLPATIVSRCQHIRLSPPAAGVARDWLVGQEPGSDFDKLLEFSGGAPLAALRLHREDFASFANGFLAALAKLEQNEGSPAAVASQCKSRETEALQLLEWRLAERLRAAAGSPSAENEAGFRQLGQIRELRRVINGGINAELSLAGLLLDWYGGLGHRQG